MTAITFFRRYYFKNSVLEIHPSQMAIVCLVLAAKTEEFYFEQIGLEGFINAYNQTEKEKIELPRSLAEKYEVQLCKVLGFEFMVHTPIHAIDHISHQVAQSEIFMQMDPAEIKKAFDGALKEFSILHFLSMELVFCFSPNSIACAVV